jgi:phosphoglycerol geranylgeranyltransferase
VGGGIKNAKNAHEIKQAGADIIVTGTVLEENTSLNEVKNIIQIINGNR